MLASLYFAKSYVFQSTIQKFAKIETHLLITVTIIYLIASSFKKYSKPNNFYVSRWNCIFFVALVDTNRTCLSNRAPSAITTGCGERTTDFHLLEDPACKKDR